MHINGTCLGTKSSASESSLWKAKFQIMRWMESTICHNVFSNDSMHYCTRLPLELYTLLEFSNCTFDILFFPGFTVHAFRLLVCHF
jgi:hypothetical protein